MGKEYKPGDTVEHSGVYLVLHDEEHTQSHEVTVVFGKRFPPCNLSLLKTRFERIDGVVRQGLDTRQCLRIVRLAVCRARPSRAKRASAPHCNRKRISKGFVDGARH